MKITNEGNFVQLDDEGTTISFITNTKYNYLTMRAHGKNHNKVFTINIYENDELFDYINNLYNKLDKNYKKTEDFPCERSLLKDMNFYDEYDSSFKYFSESFNFYNLDKNYFMIKKCEDHYELTIISKNKNNNVHILGPGNGSSYPYKFNQPLRDFKEDLIELSKQKRLQLKNKKKAS